MSCAAPLAASDDVAAIADVIQRSEQAYADRDTAQVRRFVDPAYRFVEVDFSATSLPLDSVLTGLVKQQAMGLRMT